MYSFNYMILHGHISIYNKVIAHGKRGTTYTKRFK
jgi:hypothetical protein